MVLQSVASSVHPSIRLLSLVFFNLLTFDLDLLHARESSEMTIARRGLKVKVLYDVKVMDITRCTWRRT